MILRRIEPMSLAKVYAVIYAVIGLLFGLPMACLSAMMGSMVGSSDYGDAGAAFGGFGLASIIVIPLFAAVAGFIGGLVTAFIYNLVADRVGGVELEFEGDFGQQEIL